MILRGLLPMQGSDLLCPVMQVLSWMADHGSIKAKIEVEARQRVARQVGKSLASFIDMWPSIPWWLALLSCLPVLPPPHP